MLRKGQVWVDPLTYRTMEPPDESERLPLFILLHGLGADESDLIAFGRQVAPSFMVVSVRAPYPGPGRGFHWYPMDEVGTAEGPGFRSSLEQLAQLIEDAPQIWPRINPDQIVLGGFSQGAVMAGSLAVLRGGRGLSGVVLMSGYLPEGLEKSGSLAGFPVFWGHGRDDGVVPLKWARTAVEVLRGRGADVEYRVYPAGHSVTAAEMGDIARFLARVVRPVR